MAASYYLALIVVSLAILGAAVLPRIFADKPVSLPIIYVVSGGVLFLALGVEAPNPVDHPEITERLTELVVIIALMGAGLKLDRPFDWGAWSSTWRLLAITMPLSIVGTALLGWYVLGAHIATAVLMGAVIAPTDPVLAADVQTGPPAEGTDEEIDPEDQEGSIRFALTSEAGFNDGLAFPFTNLAIALAGAASIAAGEWLREWVLVDVLYKILVGIVVGYAAGQVIARFVFGEPASTRLAVVMEGAEALAATLLAYGVAELANGYGFIAVFVAALVLRHYEWEHDYYEHLHDFAVMTERLLMAGILVLFGGTLVSGLLDPLTWPMVGVGLVVLFVVRPIAGVVGLFGHSAHWAERLVIATFGIRGIGSFYYLAHALNEATFKERELLVAAEGLWALVGFIVLTSTFVHGIAASPVMRKLDAWRG
ncbi:sodium/proton antiporter, CPA1 family (TC 2.A.36) [Halopelagius inordinatus]|uniref:Sodium/proton antiporter, CPA1 family (TC 2.A.36) n=1 Tax=Halopelagius inordinatus TaxID=553467 RepID=A0A1I2PFR5_9EURY|nr:cation:proton antiporter [Halopelagius inordinatus]SFG14370.1 sodium/proton antiporter, CPA1 family (TC 2.A.36) [Halopelagius inordinatus]